MQIKNGVERKYQVDSLDEKQRSEMDAYNKVYLDFLGYAKTERRAYRRAVELLEAKGFRPIDSFETLKPGDKVYRGYHGKTVFACVVGKQSVVKGLHLVGGHTDAPRFDLKPIPLMQKGDIAYLDTQVYGGIKKFQWVTLPLALYGVVVTPEKTIWVEIGDQPGDPVFMISDILPHFGRDQAKKNMSEAFPAEDLDVIAGTTPSTTPDLEEKNTVAAGIMELLTKKYGITEQDLMNAELEIVPAGMPRDVGFDRSLMTGYGHDDRICAFAGLKALLDMDKVPEFTAGVIMCDKEEIGSVGASGMDSTFLENTVAELIERTEKNPRDIMIRRALEATKMISADVCAASDPHFPDSDSVNNMSIFNAGPCLIKYTGGAGKGMASDARAEYVAYIHEMLTKSDVKWQIGELGRAEKGGGGTIAKYMARYGMDVVDMGTPLLNMHAPWEIASKFDAYMTYRAYRAFMEYDR